MLRNVHMSENTCPSTGGRSCIKGFLLSINCMSKISTQSHAYLVSLNPLVTHIVFTKCLWHRFPCNPMCINWSTSTLVSRLLKSMCVRRPRAIHVASSLHSECYNARVLGLLTQADFTDSMSNYY